MIWESSDWKEPLLKSATWLRRLRLRPGTRESTLIRLEKELIIGFYSVRKLLDTCKVTDATKNMKFVISWFPNTKPVDFFNWHRLDELFDMSSEHQEDQPIRFICDRFIHSWVFLIDCDSDRLTGAYVATDRDRRQRVYFVPIDIVVRIFQTVGRDYPFTVRTTRDPKTGERTAVDVE